MTSLGTQIKLPTQFVEFLDQPKTLLQLLYPNHEIKIRILIILVTQVCLLIFYLILHDQLQIVHIFNEFLGAV